jgi:hypothetical protein
MPGLTKYDIHEARQIRDAEKSDAALKTEALMRRKDRGKPVRASAP